MASEDGAVIVSNSNAGCDVNNTGQRASELVDSEAADRTSSDTTWRIVDEGTADCDHARSSARTPTGFPAASQFHANTEGHASRRDSSSASSFGDVGERAASVHDDQTHRQPSPQRLTMSHQKTDLDGGTACLPGEPDGNLISCHSFSGRVPRLSSLNG